MDELENLLASWSEKARGGYVSSDDYRTWNILIEAAYKNANLNQVRPFSKVQVGLPLGFINSDKRIEVGYAESVSSTINSVKAVIVVSKTYSNSSIETIKEKSRENIGNKVFLVHGHNDTVRLEVEKFVSNLGLQVIMLFERPNGGKTIIEKFERESNVSFAIALLTSDDLATCSRDNKQEVRARQNVIFELGYFVAKLGRERVAVLKQTGVAEPSDLHGVVYTELDNRGAWKLELAKELKVAGFEIDMNKVIW